MTDPHAASIVFNSAVPTTMVPIEVTHTVLATPDKIAQISSLKTPFSDTVLDLINFFGETYRNVFQFSSPPLHDAVAVVYVTNPEIFVSKSMHVDVELCSQFSLGQTVCDVWGQCGKPANVTVAMQVDVEHCWRIILGAIERCNATSPLNCR